MLILIGGPASERLIQPLVFMVVVVFPLMLWGFFRAMTVPINYWHKLFWAMVVPLAVALLAVYAKEIVMRLMLANAV